MLSGLVLVRGASRLRWLGFEVGFRTLGGDLGVGILGSRLFGCLGFVLESGVKLGGDLGVGVYQVGPG